MAGFQELRPIEARAKQLYEHFNKLVLDGVPGVLVVDDDLL